MQQGRAMQVHIAAAMAAWWWLQVVKQRRLQPTMIRSSDALQPRFLMIVNRFRQRSRTLLMRGRAGSATAWWSQPKQVPRGSTCWCRLYFEHTVLLAAPWLPPMASSALACCRVRGRCSPLLLSRGHGCLSLTSQMGS